MRCRIFRIFVENVMLMKRYIPFVVTLCAGIASISGITARAQDAVVVKPVGTSAVGTSWKGEGAAVDLSPRVLPANSPLAQERRRMLVRRAGDAAPLQARISVEGRGESVAFFEEDFNAGLIPQGWVIAPTTNVTWMVNKPTGSKEFAEDPADGGSLVQDTPYQIFKREKSWAISPEFAVGRNALLEFWIGCSLNYEDCCSMTVSVSDDDFATCTDLWCSRDQAGEKPWQWRKVQVSLDAFAGKSVKLRFFYGSGTGDDMFDVGGYSGDYRIDNIRVSGPGEVVAVELTTGEKVRFIADTDEGVTAYSWSFPGGVPSESTEASPEVYYTRDGVYDVTLTVTRGDETATDTRVGFVKVTGTEPVAAIGYPATFRHWSSGRLPLVAPMVPVTFTDASAGFPTGWNWQFGGVTEDDAATTTFDTPAAEVRYSYLHEWPVNLTVTNPHGTSSQSGAVVAEYEGNISNFRPGEVGTSFDLEGAGTFPGSNTMKITAYAEKFSAPSRPMRAYGAYVFFTKAEASSAYYQMQPVKVSICKVGEDGLPGETLDWDSWSVFELDLPQGNQAVGTAFSFTSAPVIDSEFYIVVDGIPALVDNADEQCDVRMAMAPFRSEGNTAKMLKDGKWVDVASYFPAPANHTSYMLMVNMAHSVISNVPGTPEEFRVGAPAGELTINLFSYMGWDKTLSSCDVPWLHIVSEPGELTVDEVVVGYDAVEDGVVRQGHITLTDGVTSHTFTVVQDGSTSVTTSLAGEGAVMRYDRATQVLTVEGDNSAAVYDAQGRKLIDTKQRETSLSSLPEGVYIARSSGAVLKFAR